MLKIINFDKINLANSIIFIKNSRIFLNSFQNCLLNLKPHKNSIKYHH